MAYDQQLNNLSQVAREALIDNLQKQAQGAETPTTLTVGGGTTITGIVVYSQTITPAEVAAITAAEQTFTVTGLTTDDKVIINPAATGNSTLVGAARVSATNTIAIQFVNPTAGALTPGAGTYKVIAIRS